MTTKGITISNIDLGKLFPHNKVFDKLSPTLQGNDLNSYIYYDKKNNEVKLIVKDSTSYAALKVNGTIEASENLGDIAFMVNYSTMFDIFTDYTGESVTPEMLSSLKVSFGIGKETTYFRIVSSKDKLQLPHMMSNDNDLDELRVIVRKTLEEEIDTDMSIVLPYSRDTAVIFEAITECLSFIGNDETKNNALALYADTVITNDRRHVFVSSFPANMGGYFDEPFRSGATPVILHKNVAKLLNVYKKCRMEFVLTAKADYSLVRIKSPDFGCVLNNAISNIKPPTQDILELLGSSKKVTEVPKNILSNTIALFGKFYTNSGEFNPLGLSYSPEGIKFYLKDSSAASSTSCDIERNVEVPVDESVSGLSLSIINDSFKDFLDLLGEDSLVDFYDAQDKPALLVTSGNRTMYLAKLIK